MPKHMPGEVCMGCGHDYKLHCTENGEEASAGCLDMFSGPGGSFCQCKKFKPQKTGAETTTVTFPPVGSFPLKIEDTTLGEKWSSPDPLVDKIDIYTQNPDGGYTKVDIP